MIAGNKNILIAGD